MSHYELRVQKEVKKELGAKRRAKERCGVGPVNPSVSRPNPTISAGGVWGGTNAAPTLINGEESVLVNRGRMDLLRNCTFLAKRAKEECIKELGYSSTCTKACQDLWHNRHTFARLVCMRNTTIQLAMMMAPPNGGCGSYA